MRRHDRARFFAFGTLPTLNALALLIYGLNIATRGNYGEGETLPTLVVFACLCFLFSAFSAVKRGRDMGWKAAFTIPAFVIAIGVFPIVLVLVTYLSVAKGQSDTNEFGDVPPGMPASAWAKAALILAAPWIALKVMARMYL